MTIKKIISALTAAVMLSTCTVVTAQAAEIVYTVDFFDINEYAPSNVSYYYSGRTYYVEKSQCDKETLQKISAILPRRITVRTDSDRVCSVAASGNWRLDEESGCWHVDADLSSLPENVYDPEGILELLTIWYNVPDDEVKNEFTISPSEAKAGDTVSFDLSTGHAYAYISEVCRIAPNGDGTYSTNHRFYTSESPTYSEKGAHHVYSTSVTPDDSGEYLSVFDDGYSIYVTGKPQTLTVTNNRLPGDVNGDAKVDVTDARWCRGTPPSSPT